MSAHTKVRKSIAADVLASHSQAVTRAKIAASKVVDRDGTRPPAPPKTPYDPCRLMLMSEASKIMVRVPNSEKLLIKTPRDWGSHYRTETLAGGDPTIMHLSYAHIVPFERDDLQVDDILVASLNDDPDALTFFIAKAIDGKAGFIPLVDHWTEEPRREEDLHIFARVEERQFTMNYVTDHLVRRPLFSRQYQRPNPAVTNPNELMR